MAFRQVVQEETYGGVTMRIHRFVEKKMVARGIPTGVEGQLHYIAEPTDVHQLEIVLNNASALIEPGALQYSYGNLSAEIVRHEAQKGFFARAAASAATGESAHATRYSGSGTIWCEPVRKHFILATMDGPQDALLLDDRAFYACSAEIALSTHMHKSISGMFSGNGLAQPKITGAGVFAVESPVPVTEIDEIAVLPGQEVVVDGDFMLMYSANLEVTIGPLVAGLRNAMRSGEGFVYKLRGQGAVWVTPSSRIA
ncbi:AIM24 family protein [Porphyrobacter sp. YT40]|uniref:AIM24 family protein n=1 Tax=Porphyrobacter sp. YT40 TaxID=2547601 RepID=UPI00114228B3|nr:AIM24 family protein [Porphyrobacter sp. YT40]QDH35060.1 AIM24 family protein [Porphyrobacter sp. YT40]